MADVPPGVVTVMSTVPAGPGGDVTDKTSGFPGAVPTLGLTAGTVPNRTVGETARFVPVIVTCVPPAVGPDVGLIAVTTGRSRYLKPSYGPPQPPLSSGEIPIAVVTLTWT